MHIFSQYVILYCMHVSVCFETCHSDYDLHIMTTVLAELQCLILTLPHSVADLENEKGRIQTQVLFGVTLTSLSRDHFLESINF